MRDVWVYATSRERAGAVRADLAELGYRARYLGNGYPLFPPASDGSALGRPLLAVVVFGPEEPPGYDLVDRLHASDELSERRPAARRPARPARRRAPASRSRTS